nr:tetratricopeptide repeat protein [uncultured Deefgea sp.]
MSLLLQALKKAEEDKRRRAALGSAEQHEAGAEVAFPSLNLVEAESVKPIVIADGVSEAATSSEVATQSNDWDFVPLEVPAEEVTPSAEMPVETATPSIEEGTNSANSSDLVEATPQVKEAPIQAILEVNASASAIETPTVKTAETVLVSPVSVVSPVIQPTQPQVVAKSLFAKSKNQPARGLLPWLMLGAGLLLAGMVAWFALLYRQLTQPVPKVEVRAPMAEVASSATAEPVYTSEPIINNGLEDDTRSGEGSGVHSTKETKPDPPAVTLVPAKAEIKSYPNTKSITDSKELNPPLKFVRQSPQSGASDPVLQAWQAYQNGDLEQAELLYRKALLADPRQRDALLGMAAITQRRGDNAAASALYQRILRANPQDESAKAALLMLNSAQMPEQEAVQLEQSGQSDPMALGQYFAAQQRWRQAQEQFFLAYSANPNNADAALNLAVSLDHLQQTALAKTYYHKALQTKETIHFERSKVEQRLAELDAVSGVAP